MGKTMKSYKQPQGGREQTNRKKGLGRRTRLILAMVGAIFISITVLCILYPVPGRSIGSYVAAGLAGAVIGFCGIWVLAGLLYKEERFRLYQYLPKLNLIDKLASLTRKSKEDEEEGN